MDWIKVISPAPQVKATTHRGKDAVGLHDARTMAAVARESERRVYFECIEEDSMSSLLLSKKHTCTNPGRAH